MHSPQPPPLVGVSGWMPPGTNSRSVQVARLLKGLCQHGQTTTVVTPRIEGLPRAPIDLQLAADHRDSFRLEPVDLSPGDESLGRWKHGPEERQWIRRAAAAVKRVVRREKSRALITFGQPWSDHLVGLELAGWPRRPPWIAHFSEPWADSPDCADLPPEQLAIEQAREEQVVINADLIVFTNQQAADVVMAKYAPWFQRKVRVLPPIVEQGAVAGAAAAFVPMIVDAETLAWSYPWRVARRVKHQTRSMVRKVRGFVFRYATLENHRMNARAYWPEIGGFEQFVSGILFASLRFHTAALRMVWSSAPRLRRSIAVRRESNLPPRVLHVTSSFDLGGTQTQIKNLCTAGSDRFEHDAIENFPEMNYLYRQGERVDPARYVFGGFLRRAVGRFVTVMSTRSPQLIQTYKLVQDFKAARPDVVVGWGHEMCATTFVAATIARVPHIVFCIRTFNPAYGWTTPEMGALLGIAHARMTRYVDAVVTNSTQLKADHARWLGISEDTITACPNGITIETLPPDIAAERRRAVRSELGIPADAKVIVNVGRFSAEKGQQSIVEANALLLQKYPATQVFWLLCGDGPTLASIRDQADRRGMTNIRFLGRTNLVHDYLCAADVFVMPSDFEGMPNAMMEGMAYGLPSVSTNRSGALDVARDGIEALYYEPRDAAAMARHLTYLLDHCQEALEMGRRARLRMQSFSVRRFAHDFDRIIEAVLNSSRKAEPSLKHDDPASSVSTS